MHPTPGDFVNSRCVHVTVFPLVCIWGGAAASCRTHTSFRGSRALAPRGFCGRYRILHRAAPPRPRTSFLKKTTQVSKRTYAAVGPYPRLLYEERRRAQAVPEFFWKKSVEAWKLGQLAPGARRNDGAKLMDKTRDAAGAAGAGA